MITQTAIFNILFGVIAGFCYAIVFFIKAVQSGAETFDIKKFSRALLIGAIIGGISGFTGTPLTEQNYDVQVLAYGFVTVLVDQVIKMLWRTRNPPPPLP